MDMCLLPSNSHYLCHRWTSMNEPTNYVPAMYSNHKRVLTLSSSLLPCCLSHGLVETLAISSPSNGFFYNIYPLQLIKRFDVKIRGMSITYQTKSDLASKFEMKDIRMMHYYLGLEVWQRSGGIFLGHVKCTLEISNRFRNAG